MAFASFFLINKLAISFRYFLCVFFFSFFGHRTATCRISINANAFDGHWIGGSTCNWSTCDYCCVASAVRQSQTQSIETKGVIAGNNDTWRVSRNKWQKHRQSRNRWQRKWWEKSRYHSRYCWFRWSSKWIQYFYNDGGSVSESEIQCPRRHTYALIFFLVFPINNIIILICWILFLRIGRPIIPTAIL